MDYGLIASNVKQKCSVAQEWVYQVLKYGITSGMLPPGTQLKQNEISVALHVSHIPVREAVRRLEATGLVTILPNRGASVSILTRSEIIDMIEVRASLSVMLLRNAIPLMSDGDFRKLEEIIHLQESEEDVLRSQELNYRFHSQLFYRAGNNFARLMLQMVQDNMERFVRSSFYGPKENRVRSAREHWSILLACRAGNSDTACDLLESHILNVKNLIPDCMEL